MYAEINSPPTLEQGGPFAPYPATALSHTLSSFAFLQHFPPFIIVWLLPSLLPRLPLLNKAGLPRSNSCSSDHHCDPDHFSLDHSHEQLLQDVHNGRSTKDWPHGIFGLTSTDLHIRDYRLLYPTWED